MKKCLLFFVGVAAMAVSCVGTNERVKPEAAARVEQAGEVHNKVLDSVLNDLWSLKADLFAQGKQTHLAAVTRSADGVDVDEFRYNAAVQALAKLDPSLDTDAIAANFSKEKLSTSMSKLNTGDYSDLDNSLSPFSAKYSKKIMALLEQAKNDDRSAEDLVDDIVDLENEIAQKAPTKEDIEVLLTVTSIAKNSVKYWSKNLPKWNMALNSELVEIKGNDTRTNEFPF